MTALECFRCWLPQVDRSLRKDASSRVKNFIQQLFDSLPFTLLVLPPPGPRASVLADYLILQEQNHQIKFIMNSTNQHKARPKPPLQRGRGTPEGNWSPQKSRVRPNLVTQVHRAKWPAETALAGQPSTGRRGKSPKRLGGVQSTRRPKGTRQGGGGQPS